MFHRFRSSLAVPAFIAVTALPAASLAADIPSVAIGTSGHGKQTIMVTAGASGLPDGFTIRWADDATFASNGSAWPSTPAPGEKAASFTGAPTLNTFGGMYTTFKLAPNASISIEVGDLFQETGVSGSTSELQYGTEYHFAAFANDQNGGAASGMSNTVSAFTTTSTNCTYTQGFWKNHASAWPVTSLTLGNVNYSQAQLLSILNQAVQGNGLVSLAHQLISAKLNIASGADPTDASAAIASADALIGNLVIPPVGGDSLAPNQTSGLTQTLDDYNNGVTGPGHCGVVSTEQKTWGSLKALYR